MKLHQLRYLIAIAADGSIRAAARSLGVTQATVTQGLRELEAGCQVALLTRGSGGISLTAAGQELLEHAQRMMAQLRHAEEALARHRDADSPQHLALGITPWVGQTLLAHVLPPFRAELPHVQLELFDGLSRLSLPLLRDGSLDLMIGRIPPPEAMEGLQASVLFTYDLTVVARRDHPRAGARSIAELLDQDWILNFTPSERAAVMDNLFGQHGHEAPRHRIHLAHSAALSMTLVQQTDMLSLCPWPLVETEGRHSGLVPLQLRERFHPSRVGVVRRANEALPHAASRFLAHFTEQTRACLASGDPRMKRVFRSVELLAEEPAG
ncbi:LysR family transcriptional regulator [Variovorax ureilyticus]|uniref:LysR family transcriptional regulator n=1 Tax=Variovorax ureilyticus TaxID=1836198 RepID=A0ABU8VPX4_9BURK